MAADALCPQAISNLAADCMKMANIWFPRALFQMLCHISVTKWYRMHDMLRKLEILHHVERKFIIASATLVVSDPALHFVP